MIVNSCPLQLFSLRWNLFYNRKWRIINSAKIFIFHKHSQYYVQMILAQTNCSHPSVVSDVILVSNFLLSIAQYLAHRLISYYWSLTIHPGNIKIPLVF